MHARATCELAHGTTHIRQDGEGQHRPPDACVRRQARCQALEHEEQTQLDAPQRGPEEELDGEELCGNQDCSGTESQELENAIGALHRRVFA